MAVMDSTQVLAQRRDLWSAPGKPEMIGVTYPPDDEEA